MFSLEKDAELRKTNESERTRIIQKVLAQKGGPGEGGPRGRRGEGDSDNPDAGKPTDDLAALDDDALYGSPRRSLILDFYRQADDARRERFLWLLQRGLDPRFHSAGECGCEGN